MGVQGNIDGILLHMQWGLRDKMLASCVVRFNAIPSQVLRGFSVTSRASLFTRRQTRSLWSYGIVGNPASFDESNRDCFKSLALCLSTPSFSRVGSPSQSCFLQEQRYNWSYQEALCLSPDTCKYASIDTPASYIHVLVGQELDRHTQSFVVANSFLFARLQ